MNRQKKVIVMKLILLCLTICWSALTPPIVHSAERWIVVDEFGKGVVEIKPDPLFKNRMRIFGKDGSYKGEIRPDPLFEDRARIYDSRGIYKGEVKPDPLYQDRTSRPLENKIEGFKLP
jgi:hypothetical protein